MSIVDNPRGFFERVIGSIGFYITKKQKVYCQECGEELTRKGAFILDTGEAYCANVNWCLEKVLIIHEVNGVEGNFANPLDMQEAIKDKTLRKYSFPSNLK